MIENDAVKPRSSAWRLKILPPIEWNVPAQSADTSCGTSSLTRSAISRAALLVKVSKRIRLTSMPRSTNHATR